MLDQFQNLHDLTFCTPNLCNTMKSLLNMVDLELLPTIQLYSRRVDRLFSKSLNFQRFINPYKFKINQLQNKVRFLCL